MKRIEEEARLAEEARKRIDETLRNEEQYVEETVSKLKKDEEERKEKEKQEELERLEKKRQEEFRKQEKIRKKAKKLANIDEEIASLLLQEEIQKLHDERLAARPSVKTNQKDDESNMEKTNQKIERDGGHYLSSAACMDDSEFYRLVYENDDEDKEKKKVELDDQNEFNKIVDDVKNKKDEEKELSAASNFDKNEEENELKGTPLDKLDSSDEYYYTYEYVSESGPPEKVEISIQTDPIDEALPLIDRSKFDDVEVQTEEVYEGFLPPIFWPIGSSSDDEDLKNEEEIILLNEIKEETGK